MRKTLSLACAAVAASAALLAPATTATASDSCTPGWVQSGTGMWDSYSPWFSTREDVAGGSRSIRFHVSSGKIGYYVYSNCTTGRAGTVFPTASTYEVRGKYTGGSYTITSGGSRGWNWPGCFAGYDEIAGSWRTWGC